MALVSGGMRVDGGQQYSQSLLMTVASMEGVAAILCPARFTIHTAQHCSNHQSGYLTSFHEQASK